MLNCARALRDLEFERFPGGEVVSQFADRALAVRIEMLAAEETRAFAEASATLYPDSGATWLEIGDGVAGYNGPESAVNTTVGLGLRTTVTDAHISAVEGFFLEREARPVVCVCPLADASLAHVLARRRWGLSGFENVFVRELLPGDELAGPADDAIEIRLAGTAEERLRWAALVVEGFAAPRQATPAELILGRTAAAIPDKMLLTAFIDDVPAGTGELRIADNVGWLSADTTLPRFRSRGVQRALQRARLAMARDAGCVLAVTESAPGSPSQRNIERMGFRLVYTRVDMAGQLKHEG